MTDEILGEVSLHKAAGGRLAIFVPDFGLTVTFVEHRFNETQEFSFSDPDRAARLGASGAASLAMEVGRWAVENIPDRVF